MPGSGGEIRTPASGTWLLASGITPYYQFDMSESHENVLISPGLDDDQMFTVVEEIFRTQINPAVAQHGGRIDLLDVEDGIVVVRLMGGCQGCGMANQTLRQGVETSLRRSVPGYRGIRDITDHASGANPYYRPGS